MKKWHTEVLRSLLSVPTAPFAEEAVVARVREWAGRLGLTVGSDSVGNLLLRPRGAKRGSARWFFAAHMDHPGFIVRRQRGRQIEADFIGSVRSEYFRNAPVVSFAAAGGARATVRSSRLAASKTHLLCRLELAKPAAIPPGTIGMWDVPAFRIAGRRLSSRACDDVAGVASVLCAMGEIARRQPAADVTGLLTVAEEAGLVGATAACQAGTIPPKAMVVAIETSSAQPQAKLGDGVVVRVGDRLWTFDPALTADIASAAAELAGKDREFRFTRQLMPGGVCESTAYCLWGHRAAGLCVPLANYHNQGKNNRIAAEQIDLGDFDSLVKLLVALPQGRKAVGTAGTEIRKRLAGRVEAWRKVRT